MRQFLPHLVLLLGLLCLLVGALVGPGVPCQDPTPEMRALEAGQTELAERFIIASFALVAIGVLWLLIRWIARRFFGTAGVE
jgi:hypothetical protein